MDEILKYFPNLTDIQKEQFEKLDFLYHDWNEKINVIFITQASSEHSICIGILNSDADNAEEAINKAFEVEILRMP